MENHANFDIIGFVGNVRRFEGDGKKKPSTKVSIGSSYRYRDANDVWQDRTRWNDVTVFDEKLRAFIDARITKGSLVLVRGTVERAAYEKDGATHYAINLTATRFGSLDRSSATEGENGASQPPRELESARPAAVSDDPF